MLVLAVERVETAELFAGLSREQRLQVAACGSARSFSRGARLFEAGDEAREIYVVGQGQVELTFPLVVKGCAREIRFQIHPAGSTIAWSALVPPHRLTMSGRAVTDTELCAFPRQALLGLFASDAAIGRAVSLQLLKVVAARLIEIQALWIKEMQRNVSQTYR